MAKTKLPKNILEESCKDQSQRSCTFGTCCICVWTVGSTCEGWYALYFQRWHLHLLKKVYRKNLDREMYNRMFRSGEEGSYCAYSNSTNSVDSLAEAKKYRRNMKKRSQKDLYDRIKKDLKEVHDAEADAIAKRWN